MKIKWYYFSLILLIFLGIFIFIKFSSYFDNKNVDIVYENSSMNYKNLKLNFVEVSEENKNKFISYLDNVNEDWYYGVKEMNFYEKMDTFDAFGTCSFYTVLGGGCNYPKESKIIIFVNSSKISDEKYVKELMCHEIMHTYIDHNIPREIEESIVLDIGEEYPCFKEKF